VCEPTKLTPELPVLVYYLTCPRRAFDQELLGAAGGSDEKQLACVVAQAQLFAKVPPELPVLVYAAQWVAGPLIRSCWVQQPAVMRSS
jgi:hypothetical protein